MQIKKKPIVQEFPLKSDPDGIATVIIRQATFEQDTLRSDAYAIRRTTWKAEGAVVEENRNIARVYAKEIYATIVGAIGFIDEKKKEIFQFEDGKLAMTETEFNEALGLLDSETVLEIRDCVYRVNPTWGTPRDASEQKKTEDEAAKDKEEGGATVIEGESNATSVK